MLKSTTYCTLIVALKNAGVDVNGQLQDPPGGVGIVRFNQGVSHTPDVTTLDFTDFDTGYGIGPSASERGSSVLFETFVMCFTAFLQG